MIATLARSGSTFTLNNKRCYDAWGGVRNGATTGDPKNRYCGSLGHQQDDESALIYMRARYYEPGSGRFVSEDSSMAGPNWLVYCDDNPANSVDRSGADGTSDSDFRKNLSVIAVLCSFALLLATALTGAPEARIIAWSGLAFLASWFGIETTMTDKSASAKFQLGLIYVSVGVGFIGNPLGMAISSAAAEASIAGRACDAVNAYASVLVLFMSMESIGA